MTAADQGRTEEPGDGVALRSLLAGGLPLLVASLTEHGRAPQLHAALADAGLEPLPGFIGHDLPRGAKVGFQLDTQELRLVDEREDTLLRARRDGLDGDWVAAAKRLRGTMVVVLSGGHPDPDWPPAPSPPRSTSGPGPVRPSGLSSAWPRSDSACRSCSELRCRAPPPGWWSR